MDYYSIAERAMRNRASKEIHRDRSNHSRNGDTPSIPPDVWNSLAEWARETGQAGDHSDEDVMREFARVGKLLADRGYDREVFVHALSRVIQRLQGSLPRATAR